MRFCTRRSRHQRKGFGQLRRIVRTCKDHQDRRNVFVIGGSKKICAMFLKFTLIFQKDTVLYISIFGFPISTEL